MNKREFELRKLEGLNILQETAHHILILALILGVFAFSIFFAIQHSPHYMQPFGETITNAQLQANHLMPVLSALPNSMILSSSSRTSPIPSATIITGSIKMRG
ncbi:MAG: hypothetical protein ACYCS1_04440 [Gammaproteobacteria bacterium]